MDLTDKELFGKTVPRVFSHRRKGKTHTHPSSSVVVVVEIETVMQGGGCGRDGHSSLPVLVSPGSLAEVLPLCETVGREIPLARNC